MIIVVMEKILDMGPLFQQNMLKYLRLHIFSFSDKHMFNCLFLEKTMKKVLALLSIVFVTQCLLAEPTRYKHLHELHRNSEIRRKCVEQSLPARGVNKRACDALDNMFEILAQGAAAELSGRDTRKFRVKFPSNRRIYHFIENLDIENMKAEVGYIASLGQDVVDEAKARY